MYPGQNGPKTITFVVPASLKTPPVLPDFKIQHKNLQANIYGQRGLLKNRK